MSWEVKVFLCLSFLPLLPLGIIQSDLTAPRGMHSAEQLLGSQHQTGQTIILPGFEKKGCLDVSFFSFCWCF